MNSCKTILRIKHLITTVMEIGGKSEKERKRARRYREILRKRNKEVKGRRIAKRIVDWGEIKKEDKKWIEEKWGVELKKKNQPGEVQYKAEPSIEKVRRKADSGETPSRKKQRMLEDFKGAPSEQTFEKRHEKVMSEISKMFKKDKKVKVNDVGYGEGPMGTKQPKEIIETLEKEGKKVEYDGYDFYPTKAEQTRKHFPKEYKEKAKFSGMDIVSSSPAKKADLTVCLKTLQYVKGNRKEFAFRNLKNSTKKGGYMVIDKKLSKSERKGLELKKKIKEEDGTRVYVYRKAK